MTHSITPMIRVHTLIQYEILTHVAAGLTDRQIAELRDVSEVSITHYVRLVRMRNGIASKAALIEAAQKGITLDLRRGRGYRVGMPKPEQLQALRARLSAREVTLTDAAKEMGVHYTTLKRWLPEVESMRGVLRPAQPVFKADLGEIRQRRSRELRARENARRTRLAQEIRELCSQA